MDELRVAVVGFLIWLAVAFPVSVLVGSMIRLGGRPDSDES